MINQKKIGQFLKKLRTENNLTQEQFAEVIGVTNRSISRWENGVNMPDFDVLIQIAEYFDVGIEEILDGERRIPSMDKKTEETLLKVADYNNSENMIFSKRLSYIFFMGLAALNAAHSILTAPHGYTVQHNLFRFTITICHCISLTRY